MNDAKVARLFQHYCYTTVTCMMFGPTADDDVESTGSRSEGPQPSDNRACMHAQMVLFWVRKPCAVNRFRPLTTPTDRRRKLSTTGQKRNRYSCKSNQWNALHRS